MHSVGLWHPPRRGGVECEGRAIRCFTAGFDIPHDAVAHNGTYGGQGKAAAVDPLGGFAVCGPTDEGRNTSIGIIRHWEYEGVRASFLVMIVLAAALGGCAPRLAYVRTDGSPIDKTQEAAMLAQCKGERATISTSDQGLQKFADEKTVTDDCMARNGYIKPQ
jgi:hypothetical protein